MIPDIAVIISVYAVARLLNEYVFIGDKAQGVRVAVGIIAVILIGVSLAGILSSSASLNI